MKRGLSLPGGGCFGAFQAATLDGMHGIDRVDAVAGTSIGSVMACAVATGKTDGLVEYFQSAMREVFAGHWWRQYKWPLPKYPGGRLDKALHGWFDNMRFQECLVPTYVVAYNIGSKRPKVYESTDSFDGQMLMRDVVAASCSAPIYFPDHNGMWDGGLVANNPSAVLLTAMVEAGIPLADLSIFTLHTGHPIPELRFAKAPRIYSHIAGPLISAMLNGASDVMNDRYVSGQIKERHVLADFVPDDKWEMDNPATADGILRTLQDDIAIARARLAAWLEE